MFFQSDVPASFSFFNPGAQVSLRGFGYFEQVVEVRLLRLNQN